MPLNLLYILNDFVNIEECFGLLFYMAYVFM